MNKNTNRQRRARLQPLDAAQLAKVSGGGLGGLLDVFLSLIGGAGDLIDTVDGVVSAGSESGGRGTPPGPVGGAIPL